MSNVPFAPIYLRDAQLAPYVTAVEPAWVWSTAGTRIIWANAAAAAIFDATTVSQLIARTFDPGDPVPAQILRLAGSLTRGAAPQLECLRGFGSGVLRLMVCACSRIMLDDQTPAILIVGREAAGPPLALSERLRRLFDGTDQSIAVFSPDGGLAYATSSAHQHIGGAKTLVGLDAEALAREAMQSGWSTGILSCGRVIFDRIGSGADALIGATFMAPGAQSVPVVTALSRDEERPQFAVAAGGENVVPFRSAPSTVDKAPSLNAVEQKAFDELAQQLSARLGGGEAAPGKLPPDEQVPRDTEAKAAGEPEPPAEDPPAAHPRTDSGTPPQEHDGAQAVMAGKLSYEIRIALNSIVGFSDAMLEERFGPIGNERYRGYLADIRAAGEQVTRLLGSLAGVSDMAAAGPKTEAVGLNDVVRDCVTHMQPQASKAHVLIRTSLLSSPTAVTADGPAVRDIVVALLRNAIASSNAGGQVIVSTTLTPDEGSGKVTLRVRDTGGGLSESQLADALRQSPPAVVSDSRDSGPVLAHVKALAEGNGAAFAIASGINEGTLVEVRFPTVPSTKEQ